MRVGSKYLCALFSGMVLGLVALPVGAEVPPFGVRPPAEEGVYLVMRDRSTVKLPRVTGKPCALQTQGNGVETFLYLPAATNLSQIPIVTSGEVQGGYFVSRTEKIADIRNLVYLDSYLEGRKILPSASKDGCLDGEIKEPAGYIAIIPGRSDFDKVLRVEYVTDSAKALEILSRQPFEVDRARLFAFGALILSDKSYYPFIPENKLLGFLDHVLNEYRQGDLDPRAVELATLLEKHLQEAGESAKPASWVTVASVYRVAQLTERARAIYSSKIEPKVWASPDGKLVQELGERYQELVQAFGVSR